MATVSLSYHTFDADDQSNEIILGTELAENIDEILLPINEKNTPFFITKSFTGVECKRWRIEFVLGITPNCWGVWLSEVDVTDDIYLSQTMQNRSISHAGGIVKRGAIVIVEFGHIYLTQNVLTGLSDSSLYPCNHQAGEMHKRRPAIVVSADSRGVKVVPITSQEPDSHIYNKAIFQLESTSTEHISEFKRGKPCFALCEMIQTVSPTRILPPKAKDTRTRERSFRRDQSYYRRISYNDLRALEQGMLTAIGMAALSKKNDTLLLERDEQKNIIEELGEELDQSGAELDDLRKKYHILAQLYLSTSQHACLQTIDEEVLEYM